MKDAYEQKYVPDLHQGMGVGCVLERVGEEGQEP